MKKVVMLLTDAPAHNPENFGDLLTSRDVIDAAWAVDPAEVFVVDTAEDDAVAASLAAVVEETGGELVSISAQNAGDATAELLERALSKPFVVIDSSYGGKFGEAFELDASGTFHPNGALVKYEWDFNMDGVYDLTSSEPVAVHTTPAITVARSL